MRTGMGLKVLLLAMAALAVAVGLVLPVPHKGPPARSQFATIELRRG
jgi:hypothetical protein